MRDDSVDWAAAEWEDMIPRLLLLAVVRLSGPESQDDRRAPPRASDAQEFVDHAVSETVSGRRAWDANHSTLYAHLARIVDEGISDAVQADWNQPSAETDDDTDPEQAAWRDERRTLLNHLFGIEDKLGEMASLMLLENCLGTNDLVDALEVGPLEIAHMRKRMRSEVRQYIEEREG